MSVAGCTGPALTEGNGVAAITTNIRDPQKTQTELEIEAGRKAVARFAALRRAPVAPKKTNDATPVYPSPPSSIAAAVTAKPAQAEGIKRETQPTGQPGPNAGHAKQNDTSAALDFLESKRSAPTVQRPVLRPAISTQLIELGTKLHH